MQINLEQRKKSLFYKIKEASNLFFNLFRLNTTFLNFLKISFAFFYFQTFGKILPFAIKLPVVIFCNKKRLNIFISAYSDLGILVDVFASCEYQINELLEPKIIFDLGANVGFSALYFNSFYPNAIIYCFEPNPKTFQMLKENTKAIFNIKAFNEGIGRQVSELPFFVSSSSVSCSFRQRDQNQFFITAKIRSLDDILEKEKISEVSICKFDVEGFENHLLAGLSRRNIVKYFIGEIHNDICEVDDSWFDDYFKGLTTKKLYFSPHRYLLKAF
jgi:FkbM family methyltransferase